MSTIGWVTSAVSSNDLSTRQEVLVVDFGAQYAQLIARRVRESNVYSRIVPHRITAEEIAQAQPAAIILSGGPK
ncbi:MAG: GMP synthase (glutamine-hydrolyzing), partial [Actinobacteria bacterium]|nr:GMP synthase (glutamine-hydrolyzing) [Actinomycetota bacterium]